jgi:hypothetical protein
VDQYYLAAYKSASIKPPGKLVVSDMVAERTPTGELKVMPAWHGECPQNFMLDISRRRGLGKGDALGRWFM